MTEQKKGTVDARKLDAAGSDADVEAKVDKYEERSYWDALTPEHRKVLEEAHQLPPKPSSK